MHEKDTILYIISKSQEFLKSKGIPNPRLDVEILLSDQLGLERIKLYSNFDKKLTEEEKDTFREKIKSRSTFKPVAYIIGKKSFYQSEFHVNPSVLIPRPETEELIEWVLMENSVVGNKRVLDMGTGSGCIAITLKLQRPKWEVSGVDISEQAINTATENANRILTEGSVNLIQSNWYSNLKDQKFHIIISNPPYIPLNEKSLIMPDVLNYEPHLALFVENPYEFYVSFLKNSLSYLEDSGKIYMETHPDWAEKICEIGKEFGYKSEIKNDYSNKKRMVRLIL